MDIEAYELKKIEQFYLDAERNIVGYKRPADYMERALRILNGERKYNPASVSNLVYGNGAHHGDRRD